ncbi:hypothetical protein GPEL0_01r2240 [Geoanaerobacter pelophilus]|uniref:Uncharacterized protein n=1 Tax=Geoanaerobacter pelophilus TaxID=60036 RepID=A0ABQ0MIB4_9BACT|nr:hypothetical protein [Geoanaerobacter pelophilus]GAW66748.1 hypothetical protein GPEL0_01r2240 [Geoanaerobacter pelophilus]
MNHAIFFVYINGQSTKPLVHSLEEAKGYATRHIAYKPSLRIECYSMPYLISQWIYDYQAGEWVEQVVNSNAKIYKLMK